MRTPSTPRRSRRRSVLAASLPVLSLLPVAYNLQKLLREDMNILQQRMKLKSNARMYRELAEEYKQVKKRYNEARNIDRQLLKEAEVEAKNQAHAMKKIHKVVAAPKKTTKVSKRIEKVDKTLHKLKRMMNKETPFSQSYMKEILDNLPPIGSLPNPTDVPARPAPAAEDPPAQPPAQPQGQPQEEKKETDFEEVVGAEVAIMSTKNHPAPFIDFYREPRIEMEDRRVFRARNLERKYPNAEFYYIPFVVKENVFAPRMNYKNDLETNDNNHMKLHLQWWRTTPERHNEKNMDMNTVIYGIPDLQKRGNNPFANFTCGKWKVYTLNGGVWTEQLNVGPNNMGQNSFDSHFHDPGATGGHPYLPKEIMSVLMDYRPIAYTINIVKCGNNENILQKTDGKVAYVVTRRVRDIKNIGLRFFTTHEEFYKQINNIQ